jgi:(p)ppGpp synthase/HD superfamily hydrolase
MNAQKLAELAHLHQVRKTTGLPYILHPEEVANILKNYQAKEYILDAGWCHDTVEDTWVDMDLLESVCGPRVAFIVGEVTEQKTDARGKKLDWGVRKTTLINNISNTSEEAQWVRCADIISNMRGLFRDSAGNKNIWKAFNAERNHVLWYLQSCISNFNSVPQTMVSEAQMWYDFIAQNIK